MNRRTFETLSKYIAGTHNVKLLFDYNSDGACANPKTGEIRMPTKIASHNALSALALLMHEAAHIAHSGLIPEMFYKDPIKKDIVNAIEDARIDNKNFRLLQNIKGFYERMYRDHKRPDPSSVPLQLKLLINQIFRYEQCSRYCYGDKDTRAWENAKPKKKLTDLKYNDRKTCLSSLFNDGVRYIDLSYWDDLNTIVEKIIKLLQIDKPLKEMMPDGVGKGAMKGKDGSIDIIGDIMRPSSIFSEDGEMEGDRGDVIGAAALQEQTRQRFKELLNLKVRRTADAGNILDTDNLISYHTGDIDTLFLEEVIKHEKKSVVSILMDSSGSMGVTLIDKKTRRQALVSCVKAVLDILDEVIAIEGINVDYKLAAFDSKYRPMKKDNWAEEYVRFSGGTSFHRAFHTAITDLANDNSIDGKKMIVCFTDGDVDEGQIQQVKNDIIANGSDVRAMIIGIGTDPCSPMSTEIVGDNIILAEENADLILLETIGEML